MAPHNQSLLIGIFIAIFALINVESVGNKANLPDLPLDLDSLEYLVDEKTKKHLTTLYYGQIVDLRRFRDTIHNYKQQKWVNMLISIVNENGLLFNSLAETICGINARVIEYTEALANEKLVDGFNINVHNDIKKIFEFAVQYHVDVEESFLYANQNISSILQQYQEIGYLDDDQLFQLEACMETLKNSVSENVALTQGAANKLKYTMINFVEFTKKLANILHKLQLTIQLKVRNVEQQRKNIMIELKLHLDLCLKEMKKENVQNNLKQNIVGIKEDMQYAQDTLLNLFKDIEDVIFRREPENIVTEIEFLPEIQNTPPMKLELPLPNFKPLTINTKKSRVQELIDYFNQNTNVVTPRQLVNSAKKDVVLLDLLKKDRINITLEEKELVQSVITKFEKNCKIPKRAKGKKVATNMKPPKK